MEQWRGYGYAASVKCDVRLSLSRKRKPQILVKAPKSLIDEDSTLTRKRILDLGPLGQKESPATLEASLEQIWPPYMRVDSLNLSLKVFQSKWLRN